MFYICSVGIEQQKLFEILRYHQKEIKRCYEHRFIVQYQFQMKLIHINVMTKLSNNFENMQDLFQREFDVNETIDLLSNYNTPVFLSWGVERLINFSNKGLLMLVNGHHHKGWMLIILAWDDTYTYYLLESEKTIKLERKGVYFDMLQDSIDKDIEYIEDYRK